MQKVEINLFKVARVEALERSDSICTVNFNELGLISDIDSFASGDGGKGISELLTIWEKVSDSGVEMNV